MSHSDTARRASDVAAAQATAGARANQRDVPMTDRVADLLGEQRGERKHTDRTGVIHAVEQRLERS